MQNLVNDPASRKLIARFDREIEKTMQHTGDKWDELEDQPYR